MLPFSPHICIVSVGSGIVVAVGNAICWGVHVAGGGGEVRDGLRVGVGCRVGVASIDEAALTVEAALLAKADLLVGVCMGAGGEVAARDGIGVFAGIDSSLQAVCNSKNPTMKIIQEYLWRRIVRHILSTVARVPMVVNN